MTAFDSFVRSIPSQLWSLRVNENRLQVVRPLTNRLPVAPVPLSRAHGLGNAAVEPFYRAVIQLAREQANADRLVQGAHRIEKSEHLAPRLGSIISEQPAHQEVGGRDATQGLAVAF